MTPRSSRFGRGRLLLTLAGLLAAGLSPAPSALAENSSDRPNVVFILADDLGWIDTAVYGSQYYETPHIDRLAARGIRFTDAYAANPLCSPTRASLLTGLDPARLRLTTPAGHLPPQPNKPLMGDTASPRRKMVTPRGRRFLPLERRTIGDAFREAGYTTAFMGKWHLGRSPHLPDNHGFDVVVGGRHHPGPPGGFFAPWPIDTIPDRPQGTHIDDTITDEALRFIERHRDKPFLLNLWFYSVHAPFQAKERLIEKYRDLEDPRGKQRSPTMAAMIETMDRNVGRVLEKLDALGLTEETVIVFFSDNGGNMYSRVDGTTPTNNAPLQAGKGNIHEGGVRVPCIVAWPGVTEPGAVSDTPIISTDFYPTLLEIAGIARRENKQLDGVSIVPALKGEPLERKALFWHFPHYFPRPGNLPSTAVRRGDWKLYRLYGEGPGRTPAYELYNLAEDLGETNNLAESRPGKVRELTALIDSYTDRVNALLPKPNPRYAKPTHGWRGRRDARLSAADGRLVIRSGGPDPWLMTRRLPEAKPAAVRFRMRSDSDGAGRVYFSTARQRGFRGHYVEFQPQHDNQWHEHRAELPVRGSLTALRFDPSTAKGTMRIDWIELVGANGNTLKRWNF